MQLKTSQLKRVIQNSEPLEQEANQQINDDWIQINEWSQN